MNDLKYACRKLIKVPGFTAVALLTLALCLGANLVIFAVVDSVLLRPLPFRQPDRLVTTINAYPKAGVPRSGSSLPNYYDRREAIAAFEKTAAIRGGTVIVGEAGSPDRVQIERVSPDFFAALGVAPARGRFFTEEETAYERSGVVVLTAFGEDRRPRGLLISTPTRMFLAAKCAWTASNRRLWACCRRDSVTCPVARSSFSRSLQPPMSVASSDGIPTICKSSRGLSRARRSPRLKRRSTPSTRGRSRKIRIPNW